MNHTKSYDDIHRQCASSPVKQPVVPLNKVRKYFFISGAQVFQSMHIWDLSYIRLWIIFLQINVFLLVLIISNLCVALDLLLSLNSKKDSVALLFEKSYSNLWFYLFKPIFYCTLIVILLYLKLIGHCHDIKLLGNLVHFV